MNWYKGEKSAAVWRGHVWNCFWKWAKEENDHLHKVQKPAAVIVWVCVSAHGMVNLHICEGHINAERYIQV